MASGTVQSLVDFVEQNIENATEEELMSIHTQVLNRISEETKKHQYSRAELEPVEKANMMVDVGCAMEVKNICEQKMSFLECSVDGPVMKVAEVCKPATVQVSYKSKNLVLIESKLTSLSQGTVTKAKVQQKRNGVYQIEYIPSVRGCHELEITVSGLPVPGSPYPVFVNISPTQFDKPVKFIDGVKQPIGIAINSAGELLVAERIGDVIVLDKSGKKLRSIAKSQYHFNELYGIAVDKDDAIYLIDPGSGKLFKFSQSHKLVKVIGREQELEQFNPWGICVYGDQVIVGSRGPPCLYIFHTNLNLERKIDLQRVGVGDIMGITSDDQMNLYICDYNNDGVHVLSPKGQERLYTFGKEQLQSPHSIHISRGLLYVSSWKTSNIFVFTKEGKLVASFGTGQQFGLPSGLVFDTDGFLYVCDMNINSRLQVF